MIEKLLHRLFWHFFWAGTLFHTGAGHQQRVQASTDFANQGNEANAAQSTNSQFEGPVQNSPFYKSLLTTGIQNTSNAYQNAASNTRANAAAAGFGANQPVAQGANNQLQAQEASALAQVPQTAMTEAAPLSLQASNQSGNLATSTGAQGTSLLNANAGNTTGLYNQLMQTGGQIGSSLINAFCPARGSLYLMADGTEKPVEMLKVGELIQGIDGEPETIEEIQSAVAPVLRCETDDGFVTRNSRVHAFALPAGGFVVAMHSIDKIVRTAKGAGKLIRVKYDGADVVFNVITNGSHTYRADGVWALGVGEAERQVSMNRWNEIGDGLEAEKVAV